MLRRVQESNLLALADIGFQDQRITVLPTLQGAEEVGFEPTRALRLKGLANPRNGPLSDSSVLELYQEAA